MVVIAFPNFIAHAWMAIGNDIYYRLPQGDVTPAEIDTFIESRKKAIEWADLSKAKTDLTILPLVSEAHKFEAYNTRLDLEKLLEENPYSGFLWLRLAQLREKTAATPNEVLAPWEASYKYMPYEPRAMFLRITVGLRYRAALSEEQIELLRTEIKNSYSYRRYELRSQIRKYNLYDVIEDLISNEETKTFLFQGRK